MNQLQLSILIPTLIERAHFLNEMLENLTKQYSSVGVVEIITDNRSRNYTTGEKRNTLLQRATGKYVWFVDDDDYIFPYAIPEILKAAETDCDVMGICGMMTTDGANRVDWEIRLGHPYIATQRNGKEFYLRFPNHITPMKREHAIRVKFPAKTLGEDYAWAKELNDLGLLKTQTVIEQPIYHYRNRSKKAECANV